MVPLLTKFACRSFAVLVLLAAVAVGIRIGIAEDVRPQEPGQLAAEDLRAAEEQRQGTRDWHREYALTAAGSDAEAKAESIAEVASDQAKALDDTYQAAKDAEEEEKDKPIDVGPIPADCDEYSGNKAVGCAKLLEKGFDLDQMPCLEQLWDRESGWNEKAANTGSGAYGIPQALPGDKMSSHGDDWETNPATQILWGLDYISGRYGDPCGAWQHSEDNGWY